MDKFVDNFLGGEVVLLTLIRHNEGMSNTDTLPAWWEATRCTCDDTVNSLAELCPACWWLASLALNGGNPWN